MKRDYGVVHSKDGWELAVWDNSWIFEAVEFTTMGFLDLLGHPCCGQGPLGKFPGKMFGEWVWDQTDLFWFRVLNIPCRFHRLNKHVINLPLTREQALVLHPDWVAERESWDEEDDEDDDLSED